LSSIRNSAAQEEAVILIFLRLVFWREPFFPFFLPETDSSSCRNFSPPALLWLCLIIYANVGVFLAEVANPAIVTLKIAHAIFLVLSVFAACVGQQILSTTASTELISVHFVIEHVTITAADSRRSERGVSS
jgi:hypothetical protein